MSHCIISDKFYQSKPFQVHKLILTYCDHKECVPNTNTLYTIEVSDIATHCFPALCPNLSSP